MVLNKYLKNAVWDDGIFSPRIFTNIVTPTKNIVVTIIQKIPIKEDFSLSLFNIINMLNEQSLKIYK